MRFFLLLIIYFLPGDTAFAQAGTEKNSIKKNEQLQRDIEKGMKELDASQKTFDSNQKLYYDSLKEMMMQKDIEQNNKNLDAFMAEKKEKDRNEEKSIWLRTVLLLIIGVAGMIIIKMRRKEKV